MGKSGNFGMACHQALSFSGPFLRIPEAEAVFWPGCALMRLDGRILERTLDVLRRAEPQIRLAAGCCGQPTVYLFPQQAQRRQERLVTLLKKRGVKRIYTACPNCTLQLRQLGDFEIIPIWPVLAEYLTAADTEKAEGTFVWHDPCPTRTDPGQQAAARVLLEISGCDVRYPQRSGTKTRCCGNFHMLRATDPEKSAQMRRKRLEDLDPEGIILSSCEGCLDAFRSEGRETCHLLELLFGRSERRGWGNRIRTTKKALVR